jgi:hypothetical protein
MQRMQRVAGERCCFAACGVKLSAQGPTSCGSVWRAESQARRAHHCIARVCSQLSPPARSLLHRSRSPDIQPRIAVGACFSCDSASRFSAPSVAMEQQPQSHTVRYHVPETEMSTADNTAANSRRGSLDSTNRGYNSTRTWHADRSRVRRPLTDAKRMLTGTKRTLTADCSETTA